MPRNYRGTAGDDLVYGAPNSENLFTDFGTGNDIVYGGRRNDTFVVTVDDIPDVFNGGDGVDTLDYSGADRELTIDLAAGTTKAKFIVDGFPVGNGYMSLLLERGGTLFSSIENVVGSAHDDKIFGSDANNVIEGGGGADVIDGRGGTDTVSYSRSAQGIDVNLAGAGGLEFGLGAGGDATGDFLLNIENVVGSRYSDTFIGSRYDNVFTGGNGGDTFVFGRNIGHDTITDFQTEGANHDLIQFTGVFRDFEDLLARADERGRDVVITIDEQNSVTLENVDLRDLQANDFYLV